MDRITKGYMNNFAASQELTGQNESELFELFACYCVLSKEYPEHFDISDIVTYRILLQVVEVMRELMELQLLPIMS